MKADLSIVTKMATECGLWGWYHRGVRRFLTECSFSGAFYQLPMQILTESSWPRMIAWAWLAVEAPSRTGGKGSHHHHQAIGVLVLRICIMFLSVVASRGIEAQIPLFNQVIVSHVDISKVSIHQRLQASVRSLEP